MFRHLPEPLDAAVLHGHIGIEAFGDRVTDDRLPLFFLLKRLLKKTGNL
tara:strand:- start:92 stop:238 length:147 start_codon:yes stop_codon:yes gene_type:complete